MKTIGVTELKANWAHVEAQVKAGETFEVLNRGRVVAHIVPAPPQKVIEWPDHLATAVPNRGTKGSDVVRTLREGRY